jgi:predicted metalloprotease with PDZ domain
LKAVSFLIVKIVCLLAGFAAAASSLADITYKVTVQPDAGNLHVVMLLPASTKGSNLQIPNWAPGAYVVRDGYEGVKNLKAFDDRGQSLAITPEIVTYQKKYVDESSGETKIAENHGCTWKIAPAKDTRVEYDIAVAPLDGTMHWSGPATYLYETSRRKEKCILDLDLPNGWKSYLGLNEKNGDFVAKDYDTFADNPVTTGGDLLVDTYTSRGKTHYIVMRGAAKSKVDRAYLIKACKFVSDMETDFFGASAPYDKYVWHFSVNDARDGAGGLEHLSSTQIGLASGVGPGAVGVLAHEFFHLWNVKRIRSKPLGPFDYTKLPQTGALWWLEGVTDYYAHTLLYRYGWSDEPAYFATLASNVRNVWNNPAHLQVGPFESSMRVDEANSGHGNSGGYKISYYNQGWVAGMVLDIELRATTGGKRTLDDVEHALWQECRDGKPGFPEDGIRRELVRLGGAHMGEFYDQVIMNPGEMAVQETLAKAGLRIEASPVIVPDDGFSVGGFRGETLPVTEVHGSAVGVLMVGDVIKSVNGTEITGSARERIGAFNTGMAATKPGQPAKLTVVRNGSTLDVELARGSVIRNNYAVVKIPNPTQSQRALGAQWLAHKSMQP